MSNRPTDIAIDELLSAYIDGQATNKERRQVDALLASDAAASQRLVELRYTAGLLAQAPRVAVPRAFTLSEAQVTPARQGWLEWLKPAYLRSAAALVAVCLLVLVVGNLSFQTQLASPVTSTALDQSSGEGDVTSVIGKRSVTEAAEQSQSEPVETGFLRLSPEQLLGIELALAALLILLLAASWQLSRRNLTP